MIKFKHSVVIDRDLEEVFEFVTNIDNLPQWSGAVVDAKQTSAGPLGVGTTQTRVIQFMGQRAENSHEVTEYEPNKIYSVKSTSGPLPMAERLTFDAINAGVRISVVGEVEAGGFLKLAGPIASRMAKRQLGADFSSLKKLLEARN
jgi:uncharacterized protein YndB with AHSA1/START domain